MAFELPPLSYEYDALEPYIDAATMRLHHDKHHQTYVTNANNALEGTEWSDSPIDEVLQNLDQISEEKRNTVRNNAGGHYNHSLFWEWMSPDGGGEPDGELREALDSAFGSFEDFKAKPCMMADDRDVDLDSLDTMSDWRRTRPVNMPGQPSEPPDNVLIAAITEVDRWQVQASEQVQRLADDLAHLVSARRMLVVERVL